jgi:transposase
MRKPSVMALGKSSKEVYRCRATSGVQRLKGVPHTWSTQRFPPSQEEAFRQAVEQLQQQRGGGRVRGADIYQLLAEQLGVLYRLNGVYDLLKRLNMAWITARLVSPHANAARQAAFKKFRAGSSGGPAA